MSIFEYYRLNIPLFAPSKRLLWEWFRSGRMNSEINMESESRVPPHLPLVHPYDPNNFTTQEAFDYWLEFADFYQWPHIAVYDSFDELVAQLHVTDLEGTRERMREENARLRRELDATWQNLFHRMFRDRKPVRESPRPYEADWRAAMRLNYGIIPGKCFYDDVHTRNYSRLLS
jgi:hypothetical protein